MGKTYAFVFALAVGLVGAVGSLFLAKQAIFPMVGGPYTMKSFCLVAMAGVGNIVGILYCSLALGLSESIIDGIRGYAGWSNMVFFAIIIATILVRSMAGEESRDALAVRRLLPGWSLRQRSRSPSWPDRTLWPWRRAFSCSWPWP